MVHQNSMKKVRVLLISNMYPSERHRTYGIFVKNFVDQMEGEGFEIEKVVIEGAGRGIMEKLRKYWRFIHDVLVHLRGVEFDMIYVHYMGHSLLPFLLPGSKTKKPLVINAHGGDVIPIKLTEKIVQVLVSSVIRRADLVVVPSRYFRRRTVERFEINERRICISPSGGIDLGRFRPLIYERPRGRALTIGYVSRIDKGKGWDTFLLALRALVYDEGKDIFGIMVGGGGQEGDLKEMIMQQGLEGRVHFVGAIEQNCLSDYFHKMDIFVFPTVLEESLGLVGLEAMACGLPVVGSDIGALAEYIKGGYNGELYEPGNDVELKQVLLKMIAMDDVSRESYRLHALETAKEYDSKRVSSALGNRLKVICGVGE